MSEVLNGVVVGDGHFFGDGLDLALLAVFHLFDLFGDFGSLQICALKTVGLLQ